MSELKHGEITIEKVTENVWVAKVTTFKILKAKVEIKGNSEYNAFYKLMNFIESTEMPERIETLENGNKIYHFKKPTNESIKQI